MDINEKAPRHRGIRSFVIRAGRITKAQQRGLDEFLNIYGLKSADGPAAFNKACSKSALVVAEIGFGMGKALLSQIKKHPETHFIGIEVHPPGVGHVLGELAKNELSNCHIYHECAKEVMQKAISPASIDKMQVFFPDPWHKKKHHKRRLIQADTIALIAEVVKPGGFCHLATDWVPYAEQMQKVFEQSSQWTPVDMATMLGSCPIEREGTRFESRGLRLGHKITDLVYRRVADVNNGQ